MSPTRLRSPTSRQQSFDHHVQSFANLLNKALANPDDDNAREALNIYSFFQSTRKTYRRFTPRHSPRLNELFGLHPRFNAAHVPSLEDQFRIRALLSMNPNGIESHSVLHGFLGDPPVDEQQWLPVFHSFFVWFLRTTVHDIKQFSELRDKPDPPTILPRNEIKRAYHNLAALKYFSWNSVFFAGYISAAFAPGTVDRADSAAVGSPDELGSPGEKEHQNDEGEDDMGLDIPTEFETGEESIPTSDHPHRCIRELRLAGSNIQNLNTIFNHAPRCRFRFQVIQYPPAGNSLKPWRHLVQELFPEPEVRNNVVQSLADLPGTKFAAFRPGGSDLKFEGQAHCVAVLGCLFSLTKRREDTTWVILIPACSFPVANSYLDWDSAIRAPGDQHLLQRARALQAVLPRLCDYRFLALRGSGRCGRQRYQRPEQALCHLPLRAPDRFAELDSAQTAH